MLLKSPPANYGLPDYRKRDPAAGVFPLLSPFPLLDQAGPNCRAERQRSRMDVKAFLLQRAYSTLRVSRITVTLIWPGKTKSSSTLRAMLRASDAALMSSISSGLTITRTSRPA